MLGPFRSDYFKDVYYLEQKLILIYSFFFIFFVILQFLIFFLKAGIVRFHKNVKKIIKIMIIS